MRIIKFRGYNLKNKKWIYGYYLVNRGKHYIVQDEVVNPFAEESDFEVDSESVGQYVCSFKGVDLYEGDYVILTCTFIHKNIEQVIKVKHHVRYDTDTNNWYLYCLDDEFKLIVPRAIIRSEDNEHALNGESIVSRSEYEVIGNEYEERLKTSNP